MVVARSVRGCRAGGRALEPWVVGEDAPAYASAGGDDLAGDVDEGGEEGAEVHGEQAAALLVVVFGPARGDG